MNDMDWMERISFAIAGLIIIFIVGSVIIQNSDKRTVTMMVTDKTAKVSGENGKYLVYCRDEDDEIQVLEITDTLIRGRFNSSDCYAGIEVNKKYDFEVVGKRIPILSMYPNILKYEEVE